MPRLRSKYQGICRRCGRSYEIGEWIIWTPQQGAVHELCPHATVGAPTQTWEIPEDELEAARRSYDERMKALKKGGAR